MRHIMKINVINILKIAIIVLVVLWIGLLTFDYFKAQNNQKPLICLSEKNIELLLEADELANVEAPQKTPTTEECQILELITIELVQKMVDWDRRKRVLKDWQWKVMDDVVKGKRQLDDRMKYGFYSNLKRLRSKGFPE